MAKQDRTEDSKDIQKVGIDAAQLLSMAQIDTSFDDMTEYRVIPRLKLIQGMTESTLKKKFGEGTLIVNPGHEVVVAHDDGCGPVVCQFVPLYFMVEFLKISDLKDTESQTVIERSFDRRGDLAKLAKNPATRVEVYPGQESKADDKKFRYRYVESLRFPGLIYGDHELSGVSVVLSFERGEHNTGANFCTSVKMRKQLVDTDDGPIRVNIPLFLQVWDLSVGYREFGQNKWYGLDLTPSDTPIVDAKDVEEMQKQHTELRELFEANRLEVDGDDEETIDKPSDDSGF